MRKRMFLVMLLAFLALAFSGIVIAQEDAPAGTQAPAQQPEVAQQPQAATQEVIIADFEGWPNNLGGEVGVYGALEPNWDDITTVPYSWSYEPITPNYNQANVHSGKQSFRLVNGLGLKPELTWGSFAMDLGPTTDLTVIPKKVESFNASGFKYITFWVKGEKGGEKMEFLIRDAHALNYMPQAKYKLPDATIEWQRVKIPLAEISGKVDLTALDNIGLAFGKDVGNLKGEVVYLDDFTLSNID